MIKFVIGLVLLIFFNPERNNGENVYLEDFPFILSYYITEIKCPLNLLSSSDGCVALFTDPALFYAHGFPSDPSLISSLFALGILTSV